MGLSHTEKEILDDVKKMENEFGFNYLAYPYGAYTENAINVLKGTKCKMAFRPGTRHYATKKDEKYAINRISITAKTSFESFRKWVALY